AVARRGRICFALSSVSGPVRNNTVCAFVGDGRRHSCPSTSTTLWTIAVYSGTIGEYLFPPFYTTGDVPELVPFLGLTSNKKLMNLETVLDVTDLETIDCDKPRSWQFSRWTAPGPGIRYGHGLHPPSRQFWIWRKRHKPDELALHARYFHRL
ncbi:hypothetical protein J6590_067938, partial [Homalodisca vitripennis]